MSIFEQILAEAAKLEQAQAEATAAFERAKRAELLEMVDRIDGRGRRIVRAIDWEALRPEIARLRDSGMDNHGIAAWVSTETGWDVCNQEIGKVMKKLGIEGNIKRYTGGTKPKIDWEKYKGMYAQHRLEGRSNQWIVDKIIAIEGIHLTADALRCAMTRFGIVTVQEERRVG